MNHELTIRKTNLSAQKQALLEQQLRRAAGRLANPEQAIRPRPDAGQIPLSFAQQRLWFLEALEPGRPIYNIAVALEAKGRLDVPALEKSLAEIVGRHEVLRTTFHTQDDRPVLALQPAPPVCFRPFPAVIESVPQEAGVHPFFDLSRLPDDEREQTARRLAAAVAVRPFDLSQVPLVRAGLLKLAAEEHILLLVIHHIAADGWSLGVLFRELGERYREHLHGQPHPQPALPIQYADFAHWQREWLRGERLEKQLAYWKRQLDRATAVLELPADHPRPAVQRFRGGGERRLLAKTLAGRLGALSRAENASLFMTLLAAFKALLYRYTGQEDILVGTPIANRTRPQIEPLIGFFVNTLVLRTDLSGQPTFRQLLRRVRETALEAYAHQDIPFEKLVEEIQPARSLSHTPLFQVMFILQNAAMTPPELPGVSLRPLPLEDRTAKFDLTLDLTETERGLAAQLEYNSDLFDPPTISRLLGHYERLLEAVADDPDRPLADLPLLTAREEAQLASWNETGRDDLTAVPVHHLFENQAASQPEKPALLYKGQTITYEALNRQANRLAHYLRARGVGPDTTVAVCLERSPELAAAVLAVLKAGGAYVPLDPAYPAERLAFMLEDAQAAAVLTRTPLLPGGDPARFIYLDGAWETVQAEPAANPPAAATADNLAYVIYTSGSTGRPKGVAMPHRALSNLLVWQKETLPGPARTLQFAPLSFDVCFQEMFSTWHSGGTLVLIDEALRQDMPALLHFLNEAAVERLFLPFVALQHLANTAVEEGVLPVSLRDVITAGEQLQITPPIVSLFGRLPRCRLHNHYGPSESHVVTAHTLSGPPEAWPALPPIGRPIANTTIHLLDANGRPVPIGVPGELFIGGAAVARGYLRRPELTAERFVRLPEVGGAAALYRTGDLARRRPDGSIEFLGRVDQQVKIRGFRIEVGEVEATLGRHEAVQEAVVAVRGDTAVERCLAAYIVLRPGETAAVEQLRQFLGERLPEYMIPAAFVFLEAMPLTPSGKVDRRALPVPEVKRADFMTRYAPPRTPIEEAVAAIWAEVLEMETAAVGIYDNFFDLGGHSLLATQVMSRLRTTFRAELPLRLLFESPQVAALARQVEAAAGKETLPLPPIQPGSRSEAGVPLSFAQQRLWFLYQFDPDSSAYNLPLALRLDGELDEAALARSLEAVIARHDALRTIFTIENGRPVQVVQAASDFQLSYHELRALPAAEAEAEARRLVNEMADRPFDLAQGPLLRAGLFRLADRKYLFLVVMHHIVGDGWSMDVFRRELSALYSAAAAGGSAELRPLPPLPVQYADFALWQREWLAGEGLARQRDYWRERLSGAPPVLALPTDRPRQAVQSPAGDSRRRALPAALVESLRTLSRRQGATLFMTLLAAFKALLYRYSGQQDILVGTPIANRNRAEIEGLIGFFVNTLVLRTDLGGDPTFAELLHRVRDAALDAYNHQDFPFEQVVEMMQPDRAMSHAPLFQVMFLLMEQPPSAVTLPNLLVEPVPLESGPTKFDLTLAMVKTADGLTAFLEYNAHLFDGATIERMLAHFERVLAGIAAGPDRPLSELPLLSEPEREMLLHTWQAAERPRPAPALVPELFEAQAARTPQAAALVGGEGRMNYRELNRRVNGLAGRLRSAGVGPETRVGVCLPRTAEMAAATLAVLKAGGVFVPLDPAYPDARLAFMLRNSGAAALISRNDLLAGRRLPVEGLTVIDCGEQAAGAETADIAPGEIDGRNLAYIIYTSGSTGRPKGVMVSHAALAEHCLTICEEYQLSSADRVLQFASFSFDPALEQLLPPLMSGAAVILRGDELWTPDDLRRQIEAEGCTVVNLPTAYWRQAAHAWSTERLRLVIAGGEAMDAAALRRWQQRRPDGLTLYNAYGPTETTITATLYAPPPDFALSDSYEDVPIGRPLPNRRAYVLDKQLNPVPAGASGELYLGGPTTARGYLNRPGLTAAVFVPDPFSETPGGLLYRTGDLARWRPDEAGESAILEFLGRADQQVKIRGFRVEPKEVEAVLNQHSAVTACVVIASEADESGSRSLTAYVACENQMPEAAVLRRFVQSRLPPYMVPRRVVTLASLPLTPTGKVDFRALPPPEAAGADGDGATAAPRSALEQLLASLWYEVLHQPEAGIHDNFFDLGGHSLLATLLTGHIRDLLQVELPLRELFAAPTIAGIAAALTEDPAQQLRLERQAQLILELSALSEEEAERLVVNWVDGRTPAC